MLSKIHQVIASKRIVRIAFVVVTVLLLIYLGKMGFDLGQWARAHGY